MVPMGILQELAQKTDSKILLVVCDGLAGLPNPTTGKTELETARTPNLDDLARRSTMGVAELVGPGITPGSGPGHLSLFGYDPIKYQVGRGALSALGIGFPMTPQDVAARMNFCTLDDQGRIVDRRAGRIPTELAARLAEKLRQIQIPGVQVFVEPEMEYRGVLVFRGEGLSDKLTDTDPQREGVQPLPVRALAPEAERTAQIANQFIAEAQRVLKDERPANGILVRGFAVYPKFPSLKELYKLDAAAIAVYPMYKGLAKLVGMEVLPTGKTMWDELATLQQNWSKYDFFFLHIKYTDSAGEDGDFARKVGVMEEVDRLIPELMALKPDVFAMTGDHSTPSVLKAHSWHPVPFLLYSPWVIPDGLEHFSERTARQGSLGHFHASEAMGLMLANSLKLLKYGA